MNSLDTDDEVLYTPDELLAIAREEYAKFLDKLKQDNTPEKKIAARTAQIRLSFVVVFGEEITAKVFKER